MDEAGIPIGIIMQESVSCCGQPGIPLYMPSMRMGRPPPRQADMSESINGQEGDK